MIGVVAGEMAMFDETATGVAAFEVDDFVLFFCELGTGGGLGGLGEEVGGGGGRGDIGGEGGGGCLLGT